MKKVVIITLIVSVGLLLTATKKSAFLSDGDSSNSLSLNNDKELIQAALLSPHNDQTYFFVGKMVYQYDTKTRKRMTRKLGSDAFRGIPTNIDAALVNPETGKAFIFKGNSWYRFNTAQGELEIQGIIGSDGFKGLIGPFDGAVRHGTSGNYAFFKDNKVTIYNPKTEKVEYSGYLGANNVYKGVPRSPDAVLKLSNDRIYFFKDDHYYRYDPKKLVVDKTDVIGGSGFINLFPSIDAAYYHYEVGDKDKTGVRAFKESYYHEEPAYNLNSYKRATKLSMLGENHDLTTTNFGYKHYEGVPAKVQAVIQLPTNKKTYFFKGSKYYAYNFKTRKTDKIGDIGKDGWYKVPTNIDAAFVNRQNDLVYFFKEDRFYEYDIKANKLLNPSGSLISSTFKGIPNYLDAVSIQPWGSEVYFYKKTTEYIYDRSYKRVIKTNSISKVAQ